MGEGFDFGEGGQADVAGVGGEQREAWEKRTRSVMASMPTLAGRLECGLRTFHNAGHPTIISHKFKFQKWPPSLDAKR